MFVSLFGFVSESRRGTKEASQEVWGVGVGVGGQVFAQKDKVLIWTFYSQRSDRFLAGGVRSRSGDERRETASARRSARPQAFTVPPSRWGWGGGTRTD